MEERAAAIAAGRARELVWLLEHPPIYTAGTSARPADLVAPERFPVYRTGRGGQFTYHGPGQRVAYVMLDLKQRGTDIRTFVAGLERWLILTLERFGVVGERREDRVGIWVRRPGPPPREDKIAAIGVRVRRWVSLHGISFNVDPDSATSPESCPAACATTASPASPISASPPAWRRSTGPCASRSCRFWTGHRSMNAG